VKDFVSKLDNLNRRIDEAIDVGNVEQLLSVSSNSWRTLENDGCREFGR